MQAGGDNQTRDNIANHGCTVMHVMAEGELPPFAYSIGITQQTGAPEVIVIGLKQPLAHFIINQYNRRIRAGERFEAGCFYADFLGGFDVFVDDVPLSAYDDYVGQAIDFYDGYAFKVVQIVFPTTKGIWPWDDDAPASFRTWQPILSKTGAADVD